MEGEPTLREGEVEAVPFRFAKAGGTVLMEVEAEIMGVAGAG